MLYTSRKRLPFKTEDYNQAWTGTLSVVQCTTLFNKPKMASPTPN